VDTQIRNLSDLTLVPRLKNGGKLGNRHKKFGGNLEKQHKKFGGR
jgi:hypothetical protein